MPLSTIMNVNWAMQLNPKRIPLRLVQPGKPGPEVSSSPVRRFTFNPFANSAIAERLVGRARASRNRR